MTTTYADRRAARLSRPCARCKAPEGTVCTTPNGWLTHHKVRDAAVRGETVRVWAPHRANFGGERAQITCVEKLAEKGLLVQIGDDVTERTFALTVAGWKVYREHRLVIRRLSDDEIDAGEASAVSREQDTRETP